MRPLLLKELRGYLRAARPFTILTIFLVVLSGPLLLFYWQTREDSWRDFSETGTMIFVVVNVIALAQLTLLTPSNTASAISGERERQTLDLLLVTPLSSKAVILAKLAAPVLYLILLSLATLPISSLAFFIGGVTITDMLLALVVMVTAAVGYGTVGIAASLFTRSSRSAVMLAMGVTTFFAIGMPAILLIAEGLLDFRSEISLFSGALLPFTLPLLSLSPFAAFALLLRRAIEGGSIWTSELPSNGGPDTTVPALWLLSLLLWALLALILLAFSTRRLRRERVEVV